MRYMTTAEIRESFLKFFEDKGCKRLPSSSLVPDDPSLLLTSAGMVQFKPYFLHVKEFDPAYMGTTTVQKCVRTNDIENIGVTGRHLSFFEMLGNFSFGKYFKHEMCAWAYEFCTREDCLGLPPEKLYFTVFEDDDETIEIWRGLGVPESHISRLGEDDNFWRAGPTGPCGPCSEIYFDQGPEVGCGRPDCAPGCDCDRFLEFWNCVFTQFDGQEDGTLAPLKTKNIDTGMGLERMAAIMQGVTNNYDTDVLRSLVGVGERLANITYKSDPKVDMSLRIMADHSRAVTFMIADGILPSNEGRGYVLRRLLRRAVMKGHLLGIEGLFINEYVDEIVRLMGDVYPEIVENRETIRMMIEAEESRFGRTLAQGQDYLDEALAGASGTLAGDVAFKLHDTYGFPIEVTQEICEERGVSVDMDGFDTCMAQQKERARAATKDDNEAAWSTYGSVFSEILKEVGATTFTGYDKLDIEDAKVVALVRDGARVDALHDGEDGQVILDKTPFYAEMGGEVGDTGQLSAATAKLAVEDTKAPEKGLHVHVAHVDEGVLRVGDAVVARVDATRRKLIERNHSATHVLHAALRAVLGDHVAQKGSYVGPDRLRFDFTHFQAMTPQEIAQVEKVANDYIAGGHAANIYETSLDAAREDGVTALFGEKYGDVVRVVDFGEFSRELCGGCHVDDVANIGLVKITTETSVAAGVRRIEAVTSLGALEYMGRLEAELKEAAAILKTPLFDVAERIAANQRSAREAIAAAKRAKEAISEDGVTALKDMAVHARGGYPVIIAQTDLGAPMAMRNSWDVLRSRMANPGAVVLVGVHEGKVTLLAAGTDQAVQSGFHAGNVVREMAAKVDGRGGGKPAMAQGGGKNVAAIPDALQAARDMLL